ncbi:hypothetical protein HK101_000306 [Irineochytrium annulatum]|nr:hypothetical protein HK101_000306 [Irineochytrium annulatum]
MSSDQQQPEPPPVAAPDPRPSLFEKGVFEKASSSSTLRQSRMEDDDAVVDRGPGPPPASVTARARLAQDEDDLKRLSTVSTAESVFTSVSNISDDLVFAARAVTDDRTARKRAKAAEEILDSERRYCASLQFLKKHYLAPLRECVGTPAEILPSKAIVEIFSNLEDIVRVNLGLLEALEDRLGSSDWSATTGCLGDIFQIRGHFLKVYAAYYTGFDHATRVLSREMAKTGSPFVEFLKKAQSAPESKSLPLNAYLIMPVQRIPRYRLLLDALIGSTDPGHVDYRNLRRAVDLVADVAILMNEKVEQHAMAIEMLNIQRSIQGFDEKSFAMYATSEAEKKRWMDSLNGAISQLRLNQRSLRKSPDSESDQFNAPVWIPDKFADECKICFTEFSMFRRKHHCRHCGGITFIVPAYRDKPETVARACEACWLEITSKGKLRVVPQIGGSATWLFGGDDLDWSRRLSVDTKSAEEERRREEVGKPRAAIVHEEK